MKLHYQCTGSIIYCLSIGLALVAEIRHFTHLNDRIFSGELTAVSANSVTIKRQDGQSFTLTLKAATFSAAYQASSSRRWRGGDYLTAPYEPAGLIEIKIHKLRSV